MQIPPETEYAKLGDELIGYQVLGKGPDLVYCTGLTSHLDQRWDFPPMERYLERLASFSRLISFDRRGFGISDPVRSGVLTWEEWADDIGAVMDDTGSKRAVIVGENDAGPTALMFAATFPERVSGLVMISSGAKYRASDDFPGGIDPEQAEFLAQAMEAGWGREALVRFAIPSHAEDEQAVRWMARYLRSCMTPSGANAAFRYLLELDVRELVPAIHVPTLILHRVNNPFVPTALGKDLAERIPGSRYVEIPGADVWWCTDHPELYLEQIEEFVTGAKPAIDVDRVLATVLFTDIVGSTTRAADLGDKRWKDLLDKHDDITRSNVERFGGRVVKTTGDGALATFDSPGRAIRCASELGVLLRGVGINIRAGLHTGEVERRGDDVGGIGVHIGARIMGEAATGEVLCSRTVRDLVVGSELAFEDRGARALKGVPDEWQLFAVTG
ncbi:MAG: adenylate/guanylate cyclase domain-containing protein [Actinomycetota bacterium]